MLGELDDSFFANARWLFLFIALAIAASAVWTAAERKIATKKQGKEPFYCLPVRLFINGALAAMFLALLLQIPNLQKLFVKKFRDTAHEVVTEIYTEPEALRRVFTRATLRQFRLNISKALSSSELVPEKAELLDKLFEMTDGPYRTDMHTTRVHSYCTSSFGEKYIKVDETSTYTLCGGQNDTIALAATMKAIRGVPQDSLYLVRSVRVDSKDVPWKMEKTKADSMRATFRGWFYADTRQPKLIRVRSSRCIPLDDRAFMWVTVPTKNIRLTFTYPAEVDSAKVRLSILGLGSTMPGELEPEQHMKPTVTWSYTGWLLQRHGYLLEWR